MDSEKTLICVGDIHGYIEKLRSLWLELEFTVGPTVFSSATIIFLGDYCDRGPDTREVISFLLSLPTLYPRQRHVFLAGNHDFAFSAFLLLLPTPLNGTHLKDTWQEFAVNEEREGWYKRERHEEMHLQGRRWAGCIKDRWNAAKGMPYKGSIYDAGPTFESYGVQHGSSELMKAVPDEHKKFLTDLVWVHEEENVCIDTPDEGRKCCKLIAVHAGLEKSKGVAEQMKILKAKDTSIPKVADLSGRRDVWDMPMELDEETTILVSGHHGKLFIEGLRLIIDEGGGMEDKPIAAIILPSMKLVRSKQ